MTESLQDKLARLPVVGWVVGLLKAVRLPGFEGLTLYDLSEMYVQGIVKGALTYRASAISFSFFMALFPFLLFVLNLLPYVPIDNFQRDFLDLIESLLPPKSVGFLDNVIGDIVNNQRGGLLSSVFFLSIFLMANGVNAIFDGFESSYHTTINRKMIKQYVVSVLVAIMLVLITLFAVVGFVYLQYLRIVEAEGGDGGVIGIQLAKGLFFVVISYLITATLYYFGTADSKHTRFFSPGALMTTILLVVTTYLFGIYIENFGRYNELYGSIGGLIIFMLYIWLNSNLLLLGFELNAALRSLKRNF
ncbi:YihY/virulence factor BrkB family protein [Robertkochia sediminum]|uniref:YihY/virulence factor BrkB family protein n=1 Tax=Robertkochia sediminum TaxID=2785326 RepID=UPI0019340D50|nr:YihY/virulence factor BrkB family protein [Robertkochia sediminum]MBL7473163.1 YihY/virulence factor BrkB family protein [Robertkochia sediminum]